MIAICANPDCKHTFHFFHEGRVFAREIRKCEERLGEPVEHHPTEYLWLCQQCARTLTIEFHDDGYRIERRRSAARPAVTASP